VIGPLGARENLPSKVPLLIQREKIKLYYISPKKARREISYNLLLDILSIA
jgi:hypothetical protein